MIDSKTLYGIIHDSYYHPGVLTNAFYIDVCDNAMYVMCVYADDDCDVKFVFAKQRKMIWDKFKVDDKGNLWMATLPAWCIQTANIDSN